MNNMLIQTLAFLVCSTPMINQAAAQQKSECRKVIDKMLDAIDKAETLTYTLVQSERIGDELRSAKQDVKLTVHPFKLYIYNYAPNVGAEVLWVEGKNGGDALVNPNAFPYVNLNLDPFGSILRKGQHHTLFESGFTYLKDIMQFALDTAGENFDRYFKLAGSAVYDGRDCHKVVIEYDNFRYVDYKVKKGQTVLDIAKERLVSEYMIVRENADVDDYDDVKEGQVIKVPVVYAQKSILYIDKTWYLPIKQEMWDDKGLYERYQFSNLKINPVIMDEEYREDFKDYKF